MPKMSDADLRALLAAEKADALSAMAASKLSEERAAALELLSRRHVARHAGAGRPFESGVDRCRGG